MDREHVLTLRHVDCGTEIHLGAGCCPSCGQLDPEVEIREEEQSEVPSVGEGDEDTVAPL